MGYETSKIYKLVCADGHYYYGSTIQTLNERLQHHKGSSNTQTSKIYTHIREIGWDKVHIELVQSVSCENRKQLRVIENTYIVSNIKDQLCLNTLRSHTTDDEKRSMEKQRHDRTKDHRKVVVHKYYEEHKNEINERHKTYYVENKDSLTVKHREYIEKNKNDIQAQRKRYYDENKERLCKEKREKIEQNKEEYKQKREEYREKNRGRINKLKRENYQKKKEITT